MIRRTYGCDACSLEWTVTHDSSDEPYPPCPVCTIKASWVPKPLRIKTNKSRAMDVAQSVAEGMGLSNMKDSTREGESVAMSPREPTTAENEAMMHQTVSAMREVANRSAGTVSPEMQKFMDQSGSKFTDPTISLRAPTSLVSPVAANVTDITATQAYQDARAFTAVQKQYTGDTPMGILHKARKSERNTGDPRVPVSGARMMARYRP